MGSAVLEYNEFPEESYLTNKPHPVISVTQRFPSLSSATEAVAEPPARHVSTTIHVFVICADISTGDPEYVETCVGVLVGIIVGEVVASLFDTQLKINIIIKTITNVLFILYLSRTLY
jgi:hypothetical protein